MRDLVFKLFRNPKITRNRIWTAFAIAIAADGFQLMLGPLGWTFFDEIIDVIAMVLISLLLGFHWLLLPTFLIEVIPFADFLPTWTGCVGLLVSMRKREQKTSDINSLSRTE